MPVVRRCKDNIVKMHRQNINPMQFSYTTVNHYSFIKFSHYSDIFSDPSTMLQKHLAASGGIYHELVGQLTLPTSLF